MTEPSTQVPSTCDIAIIGAGPAGLAAAAVAGASGLATVLFDEGASPGGQIYRAITTTPMQRRDVLGADYWHGHGLVDAARASGAAIINGATVWTIDPSLQIGVSRGGASRMVQAKSVIIASGALERPFPIPGWTLPGVMTVGGAQTLLKASGLVPAGRVVLAGTGPLLWLLASQLLRAGGEISAILDTTASGNTRAALRHAGGFIRSPLLAKGLSLMLEVRRKARCIRGVMALEAVGDSRVRDIVYQTRRGTDRLAVDTLLLHQGVVPNVNLAMAAGVEHRWDERQLCFAPVLGHDGESSLTGIYVAGDGAGIAGATAAEERGRLAGLGAVRALGGKIASDGRAARRALARHEAARPFLDTLYQPPRQFRVPTGDTIVCRCEEVTARQIRDTAALGCEGPNQMKAFLRCGMGPCQGRLCGLTVTELIAEARGTTPASVGYYRLRPPVKPIPLSEIAAIPANDAAVKAVVRG